MSDDKHVGINIDGTVLLGRLTACDGHDYFRKHFVFSHSYLDNSEKISTCLHNGQVYASKPTTELLEAIMEDSLVRRVQFHVLNYDTPFLIKDGTNYETLRLIESNHVLGASQVEVSMNDDKKIVYTRGITSDDTPPKNIHTLVIDPTHDTPQFDISSDEESIRNRFVDEISKGLKDKIKPVRIHANRGTLHELISIVSQENFSKYEILASKIDIAMSTIYEKYNYTMRQMVDVKSVNGLTIQNNDWPWIQFTTSPSLSEGEMLGNEYGIYFDSYDGEDPMIRDNVVCLQENSHADFTPMINYVEKANPRNIFVGGFYSQQSEKFTNMLKSKGHNVVCQPR